MKQTILKIFGLFFMLAPGLVPCHASLGENPDQCVARFGKPIEKVIDDPNAVEVGDKIMTFRDGPYIIVVTISNGADAAETIWREDKAPMTENQIEIVLGKNSIGGKWFIWKEMSTPASERFLREDQAIATYDRSSNFLNLYSAAYYAASQKKK